MKNIEFFVFVLFFVGNLIYVLNHKHLLIMVMILEFLVLILWYFMYLYLSMVDYNMYMLMLFLVFSVCEGALGLSILVSMIRTHGNDYFQSFSMI
uniref:NADH-ubiquinone oxidoreductase chain 4L n=1 Tax=Bematistes alcinoe TaxID=502015 RepID=A0A140CVH3_9NEOP|nr:NADH dehydrogenase subunit 4L [Bematistes alcinoe]AMJ17297.1 NADH dehydrogenase subunit 4L [Bematistes alcinoe]